MPIFTDFTHGKSHCRAQLFKMFANFVHGNASLLCRVPAQFEGRLDLFAKNPLQAVRQRLAQFQTEAHIVCLLVGQSHVAITLFPGHLPPKPGGGLELSAHSTVWEFHFRHHQTGMSAAININLNQQIFAGNFIAQLAQSSPGGRRPERGELFWAEFDLAFFPGAAAAHFESQRCSFPLFAETNLPARGLCCQITLSDHIASRTLEFIRELFQQKLAFDFPAVWRSTTLLHKVKMLNAMGLAVEHSALANKSCSRG